MLYCVSRPQASRAGWKRLAGGILARGPYVGQSPPGAGSVLQQFSNNNNSAVDLEERFLLTYSVTTKFCENALQVFCVNADENVTSLTDMMNENQNNCYNILNVLMAYV